MKMCRLQNRILNVAPLFFFLLSFGVKIIQRKVNYVLLFELMVEISMDDVQTESLLFVNQFQ